MTHKVYAEVISAELGEIRSAPDSDGSQVAGGPALSTTLKVLSIPFGANWLGITPRNFIGCGAVRFALNPYLYIIRTTDALAVLGNATDNSDELQDGDTTDVQFNAQNTAANGDYIYVGAAVPFRGVAVHVGSDPQNSASVLTVRYWDGGWQDITDTDGTETGGTTSMAQHGSVTWTVPTDWVKTTLLRSGDTLLKVGWSMAELYWTRWEFDAATEATWNLSQMRALNKSTAYAELIEGQPHERRIQPKGPDGLACVEVLTDAGTANVIVNVASFKGQVFD